MSQSHQISTHIHQNEIPHTHFKNPSKYYLVQLPQGNDYFSNSRKKQFSNLHHQSEIKQSNLFYEEPTKYDHGTLYVDDIEGALPNTLICQALKNKMKNNLMKRSRVSEQRNIKNVEDDMMNQFEQPKQKQKNKSLQKSSYHLLSSRMRTQPIQNYHHRQNHFENPQKHNNQQGIEIQQKNQSNPVVTNPSNKIKQLEQMLFAKQEKRLKPIIISEKASKDQKGNEEYKRQQKKNNNFYHRSSKDVVPQPSQDQIKHKQMLRLFPTYEIRKFNPTFLSAANYGFTEQVYQNGAMSK